MLENEMYIGNMVQGKYENPTYKCRHSRPVPKEKWIRVEGTHDPIIDKELWERVQRRRLEKAKPMCTGELGIFAAKTKCMYCGYTLRSSTTRGLKYLKCPTKYVSKESCEGAFIAQRFLEQAVLTELNSIISSYFDEVSAEPKITAAKRRENEKRKLKQEMSLFYSKIEHLRKAIQSLYADKANGIISEAEYIEFKAAFTEQAEQLTRQCKEKQDILNQWESEERNIRSKEDILNKYRNIEKLDRNIVETLIDYIEIGRCQHKVHRNDLPPIIIHWRF